MPKLYSTTSECIAVAGISAERRLPCTLAVFPTNSPPQPLHATQPTHTTSCWKTAFSYASKSKPTTRSTKLLTEFLRFRQSEKSSTATLPSLGFHQKGS
ncbi:hypothetical protein LINPERHAP1_LOCUS31824 [Linum perenne]